MGLRVALALLLLLAISSCDSIRRRDDSGPTEDELNAPVPTEPVPDLSEIVGFSEEDDWIQLNTGEWLRGRFLRYRARVVSFDSKKFKRVEFKAKNVISFRLAKRAVVLTSSGKVFKGDVVGKDGQIWITDVRTIQLTSQEVLSIVPAGGRLGAAWSGDLGLGVTGRSGNTDQVDYTATIELSRDTARRRLSARYLGSVAVVENAQTANNHRVQGAFNERLTPRIFLTVPGFEVFHDPFLNINLRVTPYAAVGYAFVNKDDLQFDVSLGPAYQLTRRSSTPEDDRTLESAAGLLNAQFDWDITTTVKFFANYTITVPIPEVQFNNHSFISRLKFDLVRDLKFNINFVWDRVNNPSADNQGVVPARDDFRTTLGISWKF
ncbi:MAG: DUF481 domain-containing protein [Planctomycetota bacterium]